MILLVPLSRMFHLETKMTKERDIGALIVAVILGFLATFLIYVAGMTFSHVGSFIILSVFFPLLVSLVAAKRVILIGLVPNVVMTVCLTVWLLFFSPDYLGIELVYVVSVMLGVSVFLALLVSVPIHLWRKKSAQDHGAASIVSNDSPSTCPSD